MRPVRWTRSRQAEARDPAAHRVARLGRAAGEHQAHVGVGRGDRREGVEQRRVVLVGVGDRRVQEERGRPSRPGRGRRARPRRPAAAGAASTRRHHAHAVGVDAEALDHRGLGVNSLTARDDAGRGAPTAAACDRR